MNERMAIKQELDSLREQQSEDRRMYLEMRHINQTRQGELLNRLRELDERDEKIRREEKREERLHELNKQQLTLSDTGKEIKQPQKEITSHVDLQVARVEEKEKQEQVAETRVRKGVGTYTTDTDSFLENGVEASVTEYKDSINPPKEKIEPPITKERIRNISEGLSKLKVKRDKKEEEIAKTNEFNKKNTSKKEKPKKGRKKNVMKSKRIPSKEVVAFLEGVLRGSEPKNARQLKALAEEYFNNEWTSFYDMLYVSLRDSDYIVKDEKVEGKSTTYSYNENKRQQTTEEKEVLS